MRTVQTLHDRQQKMSRTELGHRDVFGLKLGPAGLVVQVFQVRSGRVVERVELGTEAAIVGATEGEVLEAAIQQFYELRVAPPEVHVRPNLDNRDALETWLADQRPAGEDPRPQRGEKRGLIDLANRNAALAYQNRYNQATAAQHDALETPAPSWRCPRCRAASNVSTSPPSRAARLSRRWLFAKTGG
jgi:excinuclease ABC subunit C